MRPVAAPPTNCRCRSWHQQARRASSAEAGREIRASVARSRATSRVGRSGPATSRSGDGRQPGAAALEAAGDPRRDRTDRRGRRAAACSATGRFHTTAPSPPDRALLAPGEALPIERIPYGPSVTGARDSRLYPAPPLWKTCALAVDNLSGRAAGLARSFTRSPAATGHHGCRDLRPVLARRVPQYAPRCASGVRRDYVALLVSPAPGEIVRARTSKISGTETAPSSAPGPHARSFMHRLRARLPPSGQLRDRPSRGRARWFMRDLHRRGFENPGRNVHRDASAPRFSRIAGPKIRDRERWFMPDMTSEAFDSPVALLTAPRSR